MSIAQCVRCHHEFVYPASAKQKYCSRLCYLADQHPFPLEQRFWKYVLQQEPDACWPWLGAIDKKGYGVFSIAVGKHDHRINKRAHRIAHELTYGALLPGFQINHLCTMRHCCNPVHGYVGTQQENVRDMIVAGSHVQAKLTPALVQDIRHSSASAYALAELYNIDARTILKVRRYQTWRSFFS